MTSGRGVKLPEGEASSGCSPCGCVDLCGPNSEYAEGMPCHGVELVAVVARVSTLWDPAMLSSGVSLSSPGKE